jgi:hypothetical protein
VDPWTIGLVAVVVVGLALIIYGALSDRAKNKRAAVEMLAPPARDIPQFRPDSPAPTYLSELQARRAPEAVLAPELTTAEREQLAQQVKDPTTVKIAAGFLSRDFVTDRSTSQAVLDTPRVLVCTDRVESMRELLMILEKLVLSRTPLVIVAPSLSDEVRHTLEVNQIQGVLRLLAVTTSGGELDRAAAATRAQPRSRSDLQAGYVWPEHLGTCTRWVSTAKASFVIGPAGSDSPS